MQECNQVVKALTDNETILLKTVAFWLRGEMLRRLKDSSPSPELLWDQSQSNFQDSCDALERVGLFTTEGGFWCVLEIENDQPELSGQLARIDLDHLLNALACHSPYVDDLYRHYEVVTPTDMTLRDVCRAMAKCGYMKAISTKTFEWTDSFGPWLVLNNAWDLDEFETAPQREVEVALEKIPERARERLSGSCCHYQPEFVRWFFAHWIDGKWKEDEFRQTPSDDWDLNLAAGLYVQLQGE